MRLIDEKKYIKKSYLRKMAMCEPQYTMETKKDVETLMRLIEDAPLVDVAPVRHGRCDMCETMEKGHGRIRLYHGNGWQVAIDRGVDGYELVISHCGEHFATKIDYCPYCGAKMEGKNEDGVD